MEAYYTIDEVAARLRCHHSTIRDRITSGKLRACRPAYRYLISESDLQAYIDSTSPAARAAAQREADKARVERMFNTQARRPAAAPSGSRASGRSL